MAQHPAGERTVGQDPGRQPDADPPAGQLPEGPLRRVSEDLLADCVHCGFCLPTCPTYELWGEEMDSPRGRIYLMELARSGEVPLDETVVSHFDACLGCMACVTACPSGVAYDRLIEDTRAEVERSHRRRPADRAWRWWAFHLFPYPRRLVAAAAAGWAYQRLGVAGWLRRSGAVDRLPARLGALDGLLPDIRWGALRRRLPARVPARGPARRRVGLVTGCVQSVFFGQVNAATARVLALEGCEVVIPPRQGCCGALLVHAGRERDAVAHARRLTATFEAADVDAVVVNAAGCGSTLKDYGRLLADDPTWADRARALAGRVRDVHEFLGELDPRADRRPLRLSGRARSARDVTVAYHDPCHLRHAQPSDGAGPSGHARRLLAAIPGVRLVEVGEPDICCGSAGLYNLLQPEPAAELGARKATRVVACDPDVVVSANPGCLLQLRRHLTAQAGRSVPLLHPVQLLDGSLRG